MEGNSNSDSDSNMSTSTAQSFPSTSAPTQFVNYRPSQNSHGNEKCTFNQYINQNEKESPITKLPGCAEPPANFTGRSHFLEKLHENVEAADQESQTLSRLCVIAGLGGIGMSSVARQYAKKYKEYFNGNVAWINAETLASATNSFVVVASKLKIDNCEDLCRSVSVVTDKDERSKAKDPLARFHRLVDGVYTHLNTHQAAFKKALFIFDNAQQLGDAEGKFKFGLHHCLPKNTLNFNFLPIFLATSRIIVWGRPVDNIKVLLLYKLDPAETETYFLTTFGLPIELKEPKIPELCTILGGLPLALKLASAAIASKWRNRTTVKEKIESIDNYIQEFNQNPLVWAEQKGPHTFYDYDKDDETMSKVWEITVQRIKSHDNGALALRMLQMCAFLPTDFISCRLLHFMHNKIYVTVRTIMEHKRSLARETVEALELLEEFSMIELEAVEDFPKESEKIREYAILNEQFFYHADSGCGKIHIHRLVQKMERIKLSLFSDTSRDEEALSLNPDAFSPCSTVLRFFFHHNQFFYTLSQTELIFQLFKECKWPDGSYKDCLALCHSYQGFDDRSSFLKEIHDFLQEKRRNETDDKFLTLCKLLMIRNHHHNLIFNSRKGTKLNHLDQLDNSSLFDKNDQLYSIKADKFLDWLLDRVLLDLDNRCLQAEAVKMFDTFCSKNPDEFEKTEFRSKLLDWLRQYHIKVLHDPKPMSREFEYQKGLESILKNMQAASQTLFKLAAPLLSMDEALGMLAKTVEVCGEGQLEEFNCWRYFDNNLFHVPGIPWDFREKCTISDGDADAETFCKTLVKNRPFLQALVNCVQIFAKNVQEDFEKLEKQFEQKSKCLNRTNNSLEIMVRNNCSIPRHTIHLLTLLTHFDESATALLSSHPDLPLLLKSALSSFIHTESDREFDTRLPFLLVGCLALWPSLIKCNTRPPHVQQIQELYEKETTKLAEMLDWGIQWLQKRRRRMLEKLVIISPSAKLLLFSRIKAKINQVVECADTQQIDRLVNLDNWIKVFRGLGAFIGEWERR